MIITLIVSTPSLVFNQFAILFFSVIVILVFCFVPIKAMTYLFIIVVSVELSVATDKLTLAVCGNRVLISLAISGVCSLYFVYSYRASYNRAFFFVSSLSKVA